ncbi:MAG: hypothetical protein D6808_02660 [Candidatus Dadabacteria bacterium]|nr:MAG: hypothetical protein D6808_02660 [Candidatus Dadabacteria bacterium]
MGGMNKREDKKDFLSIDITGAEDVRESIEDALTKIDAAGLLRIEEGYTIPSLDKVLPAGFAAQRCTDPDVQDAYITQTGRAVFADFSSLPPPEPLVSSLKLVDESPPGITVWVKLPRFPTLLIPHLVDRDRKWEHYKVEDERVCIRIF